MSPISTNLGFALGALCAAQPRLWQAMIGSVSNPMFHAMQNAYRQPLDSSRALAERWTKVGLAMYDYWNYVFGLSLALGNTLRWPAADQPAVKALPTWNAFQQMVDQRRQWQSFWSSWVSPVGAQEGVTVPLKAKNKKTLVMLIPTDWAA